MLRLSYNDFVESPEAKMKEICDSLVLRYKSGMMRNNKNCYHNIAGTRGGSSLGMIRPHESWRERLSEIDRLLFVSLRGTLFQPSFWSFK
jgi:hypothetical protein